MGDSRSSKYRLVIYQKILNHQILFSSPFIIVNEQNIRCKTLWYLNYQAWIQGKKMSRITMKKSNQ